MLEKDLALELVDKRELLATAHKTVLVESARARAAVAALILQSEILQVNEQIRRQVLVLPLLTRAHRNIRWTEEENCFAECS